MRKIVLVTGNELKINLAKHAARELGIELDVREYPIDEIQSEDGEQIIRDKVLRAFEHAQAPVIVSDDCWSILALGGFPGAYMKSMNHWLSAEDFLRLMEPFEDRRVVLTQRVAYHDGEQTLVLANDTPGTVLKEIRGTDDDHPNWRVMAMEGDDGLSIAEVYRLGKDVFSRAPTDIWRQMYRQITSGAIDARG